VYLECRKFFPTNHQVRKKGKHFNDEADHRKKPKLPKDASWKVLFSSIIGRQAVLTQSVCLDAHANG
jgi:hypothetical protein